MFYSADQRKVHGVGGIVLKDAIPRRANLWIFYPNLLQLNLLLLGAIVCDVTNGYDNSMVNGLQLLDQWQNYFGHPGASTLGLITSGNRIGQVASLFIISPLIHKFGRRWPIFIGSVILLVGVVLQSAAQNLAMFVIGRVVVGFGNTIQQAACPILISELAHPNHRPQLTALMNTTGSIGQIFAAWVTYGTADLGPTSWAWRVPSILQAVSSMFQMVMVFFMPESPRWLVVQDRADEARKIITKYHAEDDADAEIVQFEMAEMQYILELERSKRSSWMEWFRTPANRHRFFIVITLAFMIQWCGNAVVSYYLKLVLEAIGITNGTTQLLINGGNAISAFCFAVFYALMIDHFGRRKLFLTGMAGMFCVLLIMTILSGINAQQNFKSNGLSAASLAMFFSFGVFYKMAGTTQDPYFMEISPYGLRAKTSVVKMFGDAGANIFSAFVNPIGLEKIGWKYFIVWCCMLVSNFAVIYFFFPETKNLSLEEVTQLFDGGEVPDQVAKGRHHDDHEDVKSATIDAVNAVKV